MAAFVRIKIKASDSVYAIGVVSRMLSMPEWTLRNLEKEGLVCPKRFKKNRFYSMNDIRRLEYIQYLMEEKNVNVGGIKVILNLKKNRS